ncbi:MAG: hypothetical protein ACK55I_12395, partial [bacterium]
MRATTVWRCPPCPASTSTPLSAREACSGRCSAPNSWSISPRAARPRSRPTSSARSHPSDSCARRCGARGFAKLPRPASST